MILYAYAIADGLDALDGRRGAAAEPLELLTFDSLTIIVGARPALPPVDQPSLEAQDRVVRDLHKRAAALLPFRFGAGFADDAAIARAIRPRASALREALATVRGREQMTLRITGARGAAGATGATGAAGATGAGSVESASSGREYLERRIERLTPVEIVPLMNALAGIQRASRVDVGRTAGVIATAYHLVDRGSSVDYEHAARTAAAALSDISVRISGPSPCYAFANI